MKKCHNTLDNGIYERLNLTYIPFTSTQHIYILPFPIVLMEIKEKVCPYCGKVVISIYDKQLDYNYKAHLLACKKRE